MAHHCRRFLPVSRIRYSIDDKPFLGAVSAARGYATMNPVTSERRGIGRAIATLRPANLIAANQPVLDLSDIKCPSVSVRINGQLGKIGSGLYYMSRKDSFGRNINEKFPPNTRGVFYLSEYSEIRFRLCDSVNGFERGSDLQCRDGRTWSISLAQMAANPKRYGQMLALLQQEFSMHFDPCRDRYRVVSTFSPERLMSTGHSIFDISGIGRVRGTLSSQRVFDYITYLSSSRAITPFPPSTKGIFYYHQSKTFPTKVGEIRFRLCQDSRNFVEGSDLRLPSGDIWRIDSHSLVMRPYYKAIRDHLIQEQLLSADSHSEIPQSILDSGHKRVISKLGEPFILELSVLRSDLLLVSRHPQWSSISLRLYNFLYNETNPPSFSGRAVVCLEQYPLNTASGQASHRKPLLAVRFLEALTPIQRLPTGGRVMEPVPGEFLTVSDPKLGSKPWGCGFRSGNNKGQVVAHWIDQQSSQPVVSSDC